MQQKQICKFFLIKKFQDIKLNPGQVSDTSVMNRSQLKRLAEAHYRNVKKMKDNAYRFTVNCKQDKDVLEFPE